MEQADTTLTLSVQLISNSFRRLYHTVRGAGAHVGEHIDMQIRTRNRGQTLRAESSQVQACWPKNKKKCKKLHHVAFKLEPAFLLFCLFSH